MMSAVDTFPVLLSIRVAACAMVIALPLGLSLAWIQARKRYRFRGAVDALILLPLVLPPSVVGFLLVYTFGTQTGPGALLYRVFGIRTVFTSTAAVIAAIVVSTPLLVKTAQAALSSVNPDLERVGKTLGLGPAALFLRVTLPAAWRGVLAGVILAFARAAGEFGATIMFAGHIPGQTNTMPLEIFAAYQSGDDSRAMLYVVILTVMSVGVTFSASSLGGRTEPL